MSKKIVLTGGGTAGHVTPNLALLPYLKQEGYEVIYIGSQNGIERTLIEAEGIPYYGISTGKLRRYLSKENLKDVFKVLKGISEAKRLLKKLKPDLVFSKGGFVAVPVVLGAKKNHVPVIIHESDITPGLANKIAMPSARVICATFPETLQYVPKGKGVHTGTPIRKELFEGEREKGLSACGFSGEKPVLLMMGGSLGVVSALILGQAAAEADLVSPLLIVLVALSGLGSFVMPDYTSSIALRIAQLALVVAAGLAGYFGLVLCLLILMLHIFAQTSLGAPLCAPFAPRRARNPDLALRMPVWRQRLRGYLSNPAAMLRSRGRMRAWEKKDE